MSFSIIFRVRFVIFCMGRMALSISRKLAMSVLLIVLVMTAVSGKMIMNVITPMVSLSQLGRGRMVAVA